MVLASTLDTLAPASSVPGDSVIGRRSRKIVFDGPAFSRLTIRTRSSTSGISHVPRSIRLITITPRNTPPAASIPSRAPSRIQRRYQRRRGGGGGGGGRRERAGSRERRSGFAIGPAMVPQVRGTHGSSRTRYPRPMARASWLLCLALAGPGCSVVFGVDVPSEVMIVDGDADGDGVPNGDDLCPLLPQTTADADGDGVGDECDPDRNNPAEPDCLVLFDGFGYGRANPTLDSRWTVLGSTPDFQPSGSVLFRDGSLPTIIYAPGPFEPTQVTLRFYIANQTEEPTRLLQVLLAPSVSDDAYGHACALVDLDASDNVNPLDLAWTTLSPGKELKPESKEGVDYTFDGLSGELRWSSNTCSSDAGPGGASSRDNTSGPARASGALGLRVTNLAIELSSIAAYSKRCP